MPLRSMHPAVLGLAFALIPLFPAFITLTGAAVPGVSVVPQAVVSGLLALACAIAAWFVVATATAKGDRSPVLIPLAMLPAAAAVAALLGFDARSGALFVVVLAFGLSWHAMVARFYRRPGVAHAIAWCFLVSGALAAALAVLMVVTKNPAGAYTIDHGRAAGTFILPGELAGYLIIYVPFAFAIAMRERGALRITACAGLAVSAIAFVLTFSRAGFVGMAAAIAFLVFMLRGRRRIVSAAAIVGVALIAIAIVFNARHDPSENFTRLSIWQAALATIERFPLTGVGPFEFAAIYRHLRLPDGEPLAFHAHGFLLTVAAETGLVGIAAVVFGWWRFVAAFRERLYRSQAPPMLALAIAAGLIGTGVQGLIDTVSVVIFALWYPFMALALASFDVAPAPASDAARRRGVFSRLTAAARIGIGAGVCAAVSVCAFVQLASDGIFARAGAPISLAAHLPPRFGATAYLAIERVAPLPFVETTLADDALLRGDLADASTHADRMAPGAPREERLARIALARGQDDLAIEHFLDAGDDAAVQDRVTELSARGRPRDAYLLEDRLRRRLEQSKTRPNALADSWWRLGRLAERLDAGGEAPSDYARASALAPFNTKYLIDAGTLALRQHRSDAAWASFARAGQIDPGSADAVAGMGMAALERGDRALAERLADRAARMNARASLAVRLQGRLHADRS
jgi:O-antigen ligase